MPRSFYDKLVLVILAVALVLLVRHLFSSKLGPAFRGQPFVSSAWLELGPMDRAPMVKDLMDSHLPPGLSKEQVLGLLGDPSGEVMLEQGPALVYELGAHGWSTETAGSQLVVNLDGQGRIRDCEVRLDAYRIALDPGPQ